MIKKTLYFSLVCFILWSLYASTTKMSFTQNQWQNNYAIAETYFYDTDSTKNVIVGSSLAARIYSDSLNNMYNLSFAGMSAFNGLQIIGSKDHMPPLVLIEVNMLHTRESQEFTSTLHSPVMSLFRRNLKALRSDKQPLVHFGKTMVIPGAKMALHFLADMVSRNKGNKRGENSDKIRNDMFEKNLEIEKNDFSTPVDSIQLSDQIIRLRNIIDAFKKRDTKVIFFEMPVHPSFTNLARTRQIRNSVKTNFSDIDFIEMPRDIENYKTMDGKHLSEEEAAIYSQYLALKINNLN